MTDKEIKSTDLYIAVDKYAAELEKRNKKVEGIINTLRGQGVCDCQGCRLIDDIDDLEEST